MRFVCKRCGETFSASQSKDRVSPPAHCSLECRWKDNARPLDVRFWEKVDLDGPTMPHMGSQCWIWTGVMHPLGYGRLSTEFAHRVSYALAFGSPVGLLVCHKCDNRSCVRPDHLFLGTIEDNMRDKIEKGRQRAGSTAFRAGEEHPLTPLVTNDILKIRELAASGVGYAAIGRSFGVSGAAIRSIALRKTWRHVA